VREKSERQMLAIVRECGKDEALADKEFVEDSEEEVGEKLVRESEGLKFQLKRL